MIPSHLAFAAVTQQIIGCAYEVHKHLGRGFLEKVYVNALVRELERCSLKVAVEAPIDVRYKTDIVGVFYADLLVEDSVICEIKAVQRLMPEHEAQLLNYLKATSKKVGLLINFGEASVRFKRMIF